MTSLPASIGRVSNLLSAQINLSGITRTNLRLLEVQTQLAAGRSLLRPSDDPVKASAVSTLDERLDVGAQRARNLDHASGVLGALDASLGEAGDLVQQARSLATSQIGLTSDAPTRRNQAIVVESLLAQLLVIGNRSTAGVHYFGGSTPGRAPVEQGPLGYTYTGQGQGLLTDLGAGVPIPITLGGENAIGETSARLRSTRDFNPNLTLPTRLSDLRGARGLGVAPGSVNFQFGAGPQASVSFAEAQSFGDVAATLTRALRQYETDFGVTILGPGGVSPGGGTIRIDVVAGPDALTFTDAANGTTAADLGLSQQPFTDADELGADVDPRLTLATPLSSLPGLTLPLGSIRLTLRQGAVTQSRDVDLSTATTVDDIRNLLENSGQGVRLRVGNDGRSLELFSDLAGPRLSIEEVPGGSNTASALGLRSFDTDTAIADFNGGRGVRIVSGGTDPVTGLPDPDRDNDFRVTLGNGQAFDVDLRPQDLVSVQSVLDRINAEFVAAVAEPPINPAAPPLAPGQFLATLTDGANGLSLTQTVGPGALSVAKRNNSAAAQDLGLLTGTYDAAALRLVGSDAAAVRVNSLFSDLADLRDALLANDSDGISVAEQQLGASFDRLTSAQALVGSYAQRTQLAVEQLEDQTVLDTKLRSELADLDFAEAATRFSQLQTQLSASLQTTARGQALSLLDFLR